MSEQSEFIVVEAEDYYRDEEPRKEIKEQVDVSIKFTLPKDYFNDCDAAVRPLVSKQIKLLKVIEEILNNDELLNNIIKEFNESDRSLPFDRDTLQE